MYPRLFQFGHIAIPTYGVLAAIALIAFLALATHTARRLALAPDKVWNLGLIGILTALLGSRLLLILLHLGDFLRHPFWMLGLTSIRSSGILYASAALAICACVGYIFAANLPFRRTLDCLAPGAALALAIQSLGAFAAGADYGSPTTRPWGVIYRHGLAALWSGTPLGVRLHPVQMYEAISLLLLGIALMAAIGRARQAGDLAGAFCFVYGLSLYFLDFYRGNRSFVLHGTITTTQIIAICILFAGTALWTGRKPAEQTAHPLEV